MTTEIMTPAGKSFKSAFIALIGRPNSGKSTLMNAILGEELAVVTTLPQTTRQNLRGIYNTDTMQLIFVDTPGIHHGTHSFNKSMVQESARLLKKRDVDIVCHIVDCSRYFGNEEDSVVRCVESAGVPVMVIFNKKDLCKNPQETMIAFYQRYPTMARHPNVMLSASLPGAKEAFLDAVTPLIPEGPQFFSGDDLSDADMRFFAAEYIRKHIINNTKEEVPHAVFVEVQAYRESEKRHYIEVNLHVETDGQKAIIIGRKGSLIQKIQRDAAADIEKLTGLPATVIAHIKITPHWRDNKRFLEDRGFFVR